MSLEATVVAPFRERGTREMPKSEFVVALSLDRDWFSPDQAERVIDVAHSEGLLAYEDDLRLAVDPADVEVPEGFAPDESILQQRSTFERVLDRLTEAGIEKRQAVADVNRLQDDLAVPIEAAAIVYARQQGITVEGVARAVLEDLESE